MVTEIYYLNTLNRPLHKKTIFMFIHCYIYLLLFYYIFLSIRFEWNEKVWNCRFTQSTLLLQFFVFLVNVDRKVWFFLWFQISITNWPSKWCKNNWIYDLNEGKTIELYPFRHIVCTRIHSTLLKNGKIKKNSVAVSARCYVQYIFHFDDSNDQHE